MAIGKHSQVAHRWTVSVHSSSSLFTVYVHLSQILKHYVMLHCMLAVTHSAAHDSSLSFDRQTDAVGLRKNYS